MWTRYLRSHHVPGGGADLPRQAIADVRNGRFVAAEEEVLDLCALGLLVLSDFRLKRQGKKQVNRRGSVLASKRDNYNTQALR